MSSVLISQFTRPLSTNLSSGRPLTMVWVSHTQKLGKSTSDLSDAQSEEEERMSNTLHCSKNRLL